MEVADPQAGVGHIPLPLRPEAHGGIDHGAHRRGGRGLSRGPDQGRGIRRLQLEMEIHAIEKRPGQAGPVALPRPDRAGARLPGIAQKTARTGIRGGHEEESRRIAHDLSRTADGDIPILQRLAQRLEDMARELGELVQEEDAMKGKADLSWTRRRAATHQSGKRS